MCWEGGLRGCGWQERRKGHKTVGVLIERVFLWFLGKVANGKSTFGDRAERECVDCFVGAEVSGIL